MFVSDRLIYVQLQKTGSTHITALLSHLMEGEVPGIHRPATPAQLAGDYFFLSSIRNPWDWYVSQWAFGVRGEGSLYRRLTRRRVGRAIRASLRHPIADGHLWREEVGRDISEWKRLYARADDVEGFREWLTRILDPRNSYFVSREYHQSGVADICGFMTWRYLQLCCRSPGSLHRKVKDSEGLVKFERDNCYIDAFVRMESLEEDFCNAIAELRPLTEEERNWIRNHPHENTSDRPLPLTDYYDPKATTLVATRDRLLIERFGYQPP